MLLSHRHRFLFVHIAKTGGTSVRVALQRGRWRDPLAWATWGGSRLSQLTRHRSGTKIPRHAPAVVCREMLSPAVYARLFSFAFVRNPWDRLVSAFAHYQRERQDVLRSQRVTKFTEFVDLVLEGDPEKVPRGALLYAIQRPQSEHLVGLRGERIVDFVGRYEHLEDDFAAVCRKIGWNHVALPHKRQSARKGDYRKHYDDLLAEKVGRHFANDLSAFEYTFGYQSADASSPSKPTLVLHVTAGNPASVLPEKLRERSRANAQP